MVDCNLLFTWSVILFRFVVVSLLAYEVARFCVEFNILTIFIFFSYKFIFSFLLKVSISSASLRSQTCLSIFNMLEVCHSAISPYIDSMYFTTFFTHQVTIVIFSWMTIKTFHVAPIMLYLSFPVSSTLISAMVVVMIDVLGATVYKQSSLILRSWKINPGNYKSALLRRELASKKCLAFSFGPRMKIKRKTALTFLNTVLDNLGTAVLLIRF